MATESSLAEVTEAVGRAWKVYDLGWAHDHSNQNIVEVGNDIKSLAQNLNNIVRVVENARLHYQQHALRSPNFRGLPTQKHWDLSTFHQIAGPFKSTLDECEELALQNQEANRRQNSMQTNERNLLMRPKIDDLQERLRLHNSKISLVLKPLEIKLLADIRQEMGTQTGQDAFGRGLPMLPISGLLVLNIDQAVAEQEQARLQPMPLNIPAEIESKIHASLAQSRPELRNTGGLSLQNGVEALMKYFEQSTKDFKAGNFLNERTPSPKQYINLFNCLIMLRHLQESDELKRADRNSLWPNYIIGLTEMLRSECQRFTDLCSQRLVAPDTATLIGELTQAEFTQKQEKGEISKLMSPHFSTSLDEVYKVPLPSPQESLERELTISRVDATKLQLVESISKKDTPSIRLGEIVLGIDLKTVQFTPLYAIPSSRPKPLEVLLHTGTSQLHPSFVEPKHILRLQHLLTGYKVYDRYDQAMVKVSFFIAGQSKPLEEHGRLQLWLPQPFKPVTNSSPSSSDPNVAATHDQGPASTGHNARSVSVPTRTGFIKKRFPGLRRSSDTPKAQSSESNNGSSNITRSFSNHNHPPSTSPLASDPRSGYSTTKEMQPGYYFHTARPSSGPFELSADTPIPPSRDMITNGLYPVNPNQMFATRGHNYSPLGHNSQFAKDIGSALPSYDRGSIISPDTQEPPTPDWYPSHTSNNRSQGLQPPPFTSPNNRSPAHSSYALPQAVNNPTTYPPTDPFSQGSNEAPSYCPPPATINKYNPTLPTRSHINPSIMSNMSTRSRSSLAPTVSTIKTSTGTSSSGGSGIARLHQKPKPPLLVIFLKSRDPSAKLSIVAIQLDTYTSVKRERCECYNSHSSCRISCLEREKGGDLLAQRWEANSEPGMESFNLAKLSECQWKEGENVWPGLKRVSMKFEKMEDRYKFAGSPCSCNVKTTHELSRCNLESHNGLFGIVKQIGEQVLRNYYNQRDSANARTMVLGPLLESEV